MDIPKFSTVLPRIFIYSFFHDVCVLFSFVYSTNRNNFTLNFDPLRSFYKIYGNLVDTKRDSTNILYVLFILFGLFWALFVIYL